MPTYKKCLKNAKGKICVCHNEYFGTALRHFGTIMSGLLSELQALWTAVLLHRF